MSKVSFHRVQIRIDPPIVNAQELVGARCHVDVIGFALGSLFVQKLIHKVIHWRFLYQDGHDHKERLAQIRGPPFGGRVAVAFINARLVWYGVHASKGGERASVYEKVKKDKKALILLGL